VLAHTQDPLFATSLIHQVTAALYALNYYGDGIGHGALTASRIVISPEGHLVAIEHVVGPALDRLHLSAAAMRLDLGIPVPTTEAARQQIDGPTDYFQLALIALSMLLGRPLHVDESSGQLAVALDSALSVHHWDSVDQSRGLRSWLERALQLGDHP